MFTLSRKAKARQAYQKAQEALFKAKARNDTRAIHAALPAVREALHARLRAEREAGWRA